MVAVVPVAFYFAGVDTQNFMDSKNLMKYQGGMHLFCFATWFGCSMWVSFVAGLVMFKNLPRHVFGRLQAKLFPAYFKYSVLFVLLLLGNDALLMRNRNMILAASGSTAAGSSGGLDFGQRCNFVGILSILLVNLFYFEPATTEVMFARHKVEIRLGTGHEIGQLKPSDPEKANDPELRALTKQFGKLHGCSTSLNLLALCMGVWHICWLGGRLQFA